MHMAIGVLKMLRPHRVVGERKTRVGRFFDGGYVMLDKWDGIDAAYSLGINDDVSWDLDVAARGIPIFQYDHTIERLPAEHPLFHWKKLGIGRVPQPEALLDTIPNLLRSNGHEANGNLLLKCDIEGAEWEVLAGLPQGVLRQFEQIAIEVHHLQDLWKMDSANVVLRAVRNLYQSHRVVHVHGNNFARWAIVGGIPVPNVLELTFARLDLGEFVVSDEVFPGPLDMPCHSREADMFLGRFEFDLPDPLAVRGGTGRRLSAPSDASLRQALLRCAGDGGSWQDAADCAGLLDAAGHAGAARLLRTAASLPLGFAPQPTQHDGADGTMLGAAAAQLGQVLASVRDAEAVPHARHEGDDGPSKSRSGDRRGDRAQAPDPEGLADLCDRLRTTLGQPFALAREELEAVLGRLRQEVVDAPSFGAARHVGADVATLGAGVAFDRLRSFLVQVSDLAYGPFGSPAVFHAASRLGAAGLGPWFLDAGSVVREAGDVFGLVRLAAATTTASGRVDDATLERWAFLLSLHVPDALLHDVVNELADMGLMRAVRRICARVAQQPAKHAHVLRCIRDAGLDTGDVELALTVQRLLVRISPDNSAEWVALGEVEAAAGNEVEAEDAFVFGLDLDPQNKAGRERLATLRTDGVGACAARGGFGTGLGRKALRQQRAAELAEPAAAGYGPAPPGQAAT